jgi:hypothetical protein
MDVVWEETVGPVRDLLLLALFRQELAIELVVELAKEGGLAAIAALGHVMGQTRDDDAWNSGHLDSQDAVFASNLAPPSPTRVLDPGKRDRSPDSLRKIAGGPLSILSPDACPH